MEVVEAVEVVDEPVTEAEPVLRVTGLVSEEKEDVIRESSSSNLKGNPNDQDAT